MNRWTMAAAVSLLGAAALAHGGATGLVLERMVGMSTMRDTMAGLAPMMQGTVPFDVSTVQQGAAAIAEHAGETMTALFPEGGDMTASYARPEIWEQWDDFEVKAEELRRYALGLAAAAPNGLEAPTPAGMPTSQPTAEMTPEPEPSRLSVNQLMGIEPRPDRPAAISNAMSTSTQSIDFTAMAADDAFEMVSQSCSSCHAVYRSGN